MAEYNIRTHNAEYSIDGKAITISDRTLLSVYQSAGITDPETDFTYMTLIVYEKDSDVAIFTEQLAIDASIFSTNGYEWNLASSLSEFRYKIVLSLQTAQSGGDDYLSESNQYYYEPTKINVAKVFLQADWKDVYTNKSEQTYTKAMLNVKRLSDKIDTSERRGLYNAGDAALELLKSYF